MIKLNVIDSVPSLAVVWQPGTEGVNAIANLIFGRVNFSAKFPMTFPRSEGQIPVYYNSYRTGRPWESSYGSWYQDMSKPPLFLFGFGLSYTKFEMGKPSVSSKTMKSGDKIEVFAEVQNVGNTDGEVILQLYICDEYSSLVRPIKELKGFQKIFLKKGEKKKVSFTVTEETLKFWSANGRFEVEDGSFILWISESSDVKDGVKLFYGKNN